MKFVCKCKFIIDYCIVSHARRSDRRCEISYTGIDRQVAAPLVRFVNR